MPLLVGVVDPQDELAAVMSGQQPVEQSRPHPADVQEAGRAGGESSANTHGIGCNTSEGSTSSGSRYDLVRTGDDQAAARCRVSKGLKSIDVSATWQSTDAVY